MRSGNWSSWPVLTPAARVTVDGVARDVDEVSVSREIPNALPAQVASVGGVTAATGDVQWSQTTDVAERVPTPWTRSDYVSRGQTVGVFASDGANEYKVFTGIADGSNGSFSDPSYSTSLVDQIDKLNTAVSHQAVAAVMPPLTTTNDQHRRMIGIIPSYITDVCARASGFYATPSMDGYCIVSAPLMGATWPEKGDLMASYRSDDVGGWNKYQPWWTTTAWGCAFHRGLADYAPDFSGWDGKITSARPLNITLMAPAAQSTSAYVATKYNQAYEMRLSVTSGRDLAAQTMDSGGNVVTRLTMTGATAGAWETATLTVSYNGSPGSYTLKITTNTGVTASVVYTTSTWLEGAPTLVRVYAPEGAPLGGVQVSGTSTTPAAARFVRTAVIGTKDGLHRIEAVPAIASEKAVDILKAQSEAECAAFWIDEDGVFRWRNRHEFTAGTVVRTLTAADDLLGVTFRMDGQDVRRKVTVKYRQAATSTAKSSRLICYEGSKDELEAGDSLDEWISPPTDQDWIAVDSTAFPVLGGWGAATANSGQGSWIGFKGLDADGDELSIMNGDSPLAVWSYSLARVGVNSWRAQTTITSLPTGVDRVVTATRAEEGSELKATYRDRGLPLLRCMGVITWTDQEYVTGSGPFWAAELEHDVSWFVQDVAEVEALGQWIAGQTNAPHPVIESIDVIPDARLQLGDKVTIDDPVRTGVKITGVIIGISHGLSAGEHTMSLKLLVTSVVIGSLRLDEFEQWHGGLTVAALETKYTGATVTTMETDPTRV